MSETEDCRFCGGCEEVEVRLQDGAGSDMVSCPACMARDKNETIAARDADIEKLRLRAETFEQQYRQACQDHATAMAAKRRALAIADERSRENVGLRAEIEKLRADLAAALEDRARFPDRPDGVGRMIEAHIGNLKHGKEEADRHAVAAMTRASATIEKLRAENDMLRSLIIDATTKEERDAIFDRRFGHEQTAKEKP